MYTPSLVTSTDTVLPTVLLPETLWIILGSMVGFMVLVALVVGIATIGYKRWAAYKRARTGSVSSSQVGLLNSVTYYRAREDDIERKQTTALC